ncbi:MAG TPA: amidohydrolase family protein [Bryobacteraceae bacterium]|nr:amidohydrolase family protein [Bryobacteraceae bacterium]
MRITRRKSCAGILGSLTVVPGAAAPLVIDTHIHLFDPQRFSYHANAVYRPAAYTLEDYTRFVKAVNIAHTILVHPEPYQDDHRYLEYCFQHEPRPGFFKGTCLYDPISPDTPARIKAAADRIVALRIHVTEPARYPSRGGPIRDRDLSSAEMRQTWKAVADRGIAVQLHLIPKFAAAVYNLAAQFRATPVLIDHMARAAQGTPEEFVDVLRLARLPRTYIKFSGPGFDLRRDWVRRAFDAFGAKRILWGGLGHSPADYAKATAKFDEAFAFASERDRELIRGGNAAKLFRF